MSLGARGIPKFVYAPNRNMFRITSKHRNVPGSLSELLSKISETKLNIINVTASAVPGAESATLDLVVEGGPDLTLEEVKSKLRPSPLVPRIEVEPAHNGLLVESRHFPIVNSGGERLLILRSDLFLPMVAEVRKTFGTGGTVILYNMGYAYGKATVQKLISSMGRDYLQDNFRELGDIYTALGWCRPLAAELGPESTGVRVRVEGSFECEGQRSPSQGSHFLRGHMTALVDGIWGKSFAGLETKCVARGDDYCEFEFGRK